MVVKISSGSIPFFPLTSPPPKAEPAPAQSLVAKRVEYPDREVLVTVPFPDSIELVTEVLNDLLLVPDQSGKGVKELYSELDEDIKAGLLEIKMSLPEGITGSFNDAKTLAEFFVAYDTPHPLNRAKLTLVRKKGEIPAWIVRLEFSVSKVGSNGLVKLISALEAVLPFADPMKVLSSFRVARLDAAVDLIGCSPLDLIAHFPKAGKRLVYVGNHGRPETVYLYQIKPALKKVPEKISSTTTHGPLRLTLYERRDYHRQLLLPPPYGPCPVTRAEVRKRWTKDRPSLADIPSLANFFAGYRIAYAASVPSKPSRAWRQFCYGAFGTGLEKASWSWFPGPGIKFRDLYKNCAGDLIDEQCWSNWHEGLKHTGLGNWISAAAHI